jgi:hypothetical protein
MAPTHVRRYGTSWISDQFTAMQIRVARPEDAGELTEIAFAAKRHWGYPDRWIQSWREVLTLTPEFIDRHETYAAVVGLDPVGFYALSAKEGGMDLSPPLGFTGLDAPRHRSIVVLPCS